MITCRELIDFLGAYEAGDLPGPSQHEFERHLEICPPCLAYLETYRQTVVMGRRVCEIDGPAPDDVPEELVQAILAARERSRSSG